VGEATPQAIVVSLDERFKFEKHYIHFLRAQTQSGFTVTVFPSNLSYFLGRVARLVDSPLLLKS
jgi:hypothetical protein